MGWIIGVHVTVVVIRKLLLRNAGRRWWVLSRLVSDGRQLNRP
jgi:hypothetical protein